MKKDNTPRILCDFDGTITRACLCDFLYGEFASCGLKFSEQWAEGRIGTKEEIQSSFQFIQASREEMESALATIEVVPGFKEFYDYCREQELPLTIVSDGLEWAIRYVLSRVGVTDIDVMSNRIFFEPQGFRFEFPYYNPFATQTGVCKRDIVDTFKKEGERIVMIGDGRTDFDASRLADFVFARDALWEYCREHKIPSRPFDNFFDILAYIQDADNKI
jgi:2-hydroxy-3-keto-5-methylthiopentenyl-1-phosphate phosphatase